MGDIQNIKERAQIIENETIHDANTASRVGGLLVDIADYIASGTTFGQYTHVAYSDNVTKDSRGLPTSVTNFSIIKNVTSNYVGILSDNNTEQSEENALKYAWIEISDVSGYGIEAEYTDDPITHPSGHPVFRNGDKYMRTRSTRPGDIWSDWQLIVGENGSNGAYTDYSFGISQFKTTDSPSTPPSDITNWSDSPIEPTEEKPYLWMKMQRKRGDGADEGSPQYVRMTGDSGYSVIVQYSSNGESWHNTFNPLSDIYMRTSVDECASWSDKIRIVGEKGDGGPYTDYSFGISVSASTTSSDIQPSDISVWTDSPIEPTEQKPYLWMKMQRKRGDGADEGSPTYIRLSGTNGKSVIAQYSTDQTDWHSEFRSTDIFMRTSTDGGANWSPAMRIVGEKGDGGPYTDYSFGISEFDISENIITPPSDITEWSDSPIEPTDAKPYLWQKIQKKKGDGTDEGNATYVRINGQNGKNGYSQVTLYLYKRSPSKPSRPSTTLTYNFGNDELTGDLQGWSRIIPNSDGNPCYITQTFVSSQMNAINILSSSWKEVQLFTPISKMNKNYYFGGKWNLERQDTFTSNDYETPYFEYGNDKWMYVGPNFDNKRIDEIQDIAEGDPSEDNNNWEKMVSDFKYLISEAVFSKWARLGEWVFSGDYMYSAKDASGSSTGYQTYEGMPSNEQLSQGFIPSAAMDANSGRTSFSGDKVRFNPDGSGWLANRNIEWSTDGRSAFKGGLRSPFTRLSENDPTSLSDYSDNVAVLSLSETQNTQYALKWDISQSGRRLTLVDYQWQGSEGSEGKGTSEIQVPNELSDMWFFQNGIRTKSLKISREGVELLGYGDQYTFYGWIVINRFDIMTLRKYGAQMKQLVCVSASLQGGSIRTAATSFDGTPVNPSVQSVGIYNITWTADWFNEIADMVVQATVEYRSDYHLTINVEKVSRKHVRLHIYDIGTNTHVDSGFTLTISNAMDMSTLQ